MKEMISNESALKVILKEMSGLCWDSARLCIVNFKSEDARKFIELAIWLEGLC